MAENKSRYWVPSRTYEIVLKIGTRDLTNDIYGLSIISSVDIPYQTFFLEIVLDSNDIILEEIYGQTPMKLSVILQATDAYPLERVDFELMYLDSDLILTTKTQNPQDVQKDRTPITVTAVSKKSYKTMNTFVNNIFQGGTVEQAITSLVNGTGAKLKYDTNGKNIEKIDQILIPPSSLYKNLKYINRQFGIFDGAPAIFCSYDNTVYIKNMTSKINAAQVFTIYQLGLGSANDDIIKKSNDGKTFYTTDPITTTYKGNSVFATLAPRMIHIVSPRDRLSHIIDVDLQTFAKKYGIVSKANRMFFDTSTISEKSRISINKDHTGYELTDSFVNANTSLKVANITEMNIKIEKSLRILNLMDVGESVQVTSRNSNSQDVTGRYILKGSEINFLKGQDWESTANLFLMRTNRTIT